MQPDQIELLLKSIVHDDSVFVEIVHRLKGDLFAHESYNLFLQQLRKFYSAQHKKPTFDEFRLFVDVAVWDKLIFCKSLFDSPANLSTELVKKKLYGCYQERETQLFLEQTEGKLTRNTLDVKDLYAEMRDIVRRTSEPDTSYIELNKENIRTEYIEARDFRLLGTGPFCFKQLNKITGGIAKKELAIYIAPSNRGKTVFLLNDLYTSLLNEEKTLFLSMENEPPSLKSRLCDRILLMNKAEQRTHEDFCVKHLRKFFGFPSVQSPTFIYRSPNTFSVEELSIWLDEYEYRNDLRFDRVIVDYIGKFKKPQGKNLQLFDQERLLTDELRALAISRDIRIVTAAQTNRGGIKTKDGVTKTIDETNLQGGFGQFETADIVLGYSETAEEKESGGGRVKILKMREGGGRGVEIIVKMAPWLGLITDSPESLIPPHNMYVLNNPDKRYGQLAGLTAQSTPPSTQNVQAIPKQAGSHDT